jgi:CelD/BcsL family acetyltransferase involved in cellulose biosynthesis
MQWSFRWARTWEEIFSEDYVTIWRGLAKRSNGSSAPFFHPDVVRAWFDSSSAHRQLEPFFLTASLPDGSMAFLPLVRRTAPWTKGGGVRSLWPVGHALFDYHDPLFSAEPSSGSNSGNLFWEGLRNELREREGWWFDQVFLPRVRFANSGRPNDAAVSDEAPYVDLRAYDDFESYFSSRRPSMRSDIARKEMRLNRAGRLEFEEYELGTVHKFIGSMGRFSVEKGKKYLDFGVPAGYLENLVRYGCHKDGPVHCSSVLFDGEAIAWRIGFLFGGTMYDYLLGYDSSFSRYSPGKLHCYYFMRSAFEKHCHTFDLLRGQEAWKSDWTDGLSFRTYGMSHSSRALGSRFRLFLRRATRPARC